MKLIAIFSSALFLWALACNWNQAHQIVSMEIELNKLRGRLEGRNANGNNVDPCRGGVGDSGLPILREAREVHD